MKVFVYGTLREGRGNHHLMKGARKIGIGTIKGSLYIMDSGLPVVLEGEGEVVGECYKLRSEEQLVALDCLEGYQVGRTNNFYYRKETEVKINGRSIKAFVYLFPPVKKNEGRNWRPIENGDYVEFIKGVS